MLHDRALVTLREQLRATRYHASRGHVEPGDAVEQAGQEGRLLALEHIGAISPAEVASWRERLRDAAMWRELEAVPPPPEVKVCAIGYLERLIAPLSPSTRAAARPCFSAIAAYAETGVLTAEEALAWRERVLARLDLEPERPPRCARRDLLRILSGPAERIDGVRITSVELYGDGVVVFWHYARRWSSGDDVPRVLSRVELEHARPQPHGLTDDRGTRYVGGGGPYLGINGAGWSVRFGSSAFTPQVPAAARRLRLSNGFEIDV